MEKITRLYNILRNKEDYKYCVQAYKFIKKSQDFTNEDLMKFKSFIWRVVEAQKETHADGFKIWTTLGVFLKNTSLTDIDFQTLKKLLNMLDKEYTPFDYNLDRHYRKLI